MGHSGHLLVSSKTIREEFLIGLAIISSYISYMCPKSMPCSQGSSSSASIQAMSCKSSPKEVGESSVSSGCNRVSIIGGVFLVFPLLQPVFCLQIPVGLLFSC